MTRKRSSYRPKPIMSDPLSLMRPASKQRSDAIMLKFLSALQDICGGRDPGVEEWRALSDAINTVETLVSLGRLEAGEVMPIVNAAIDGMVAATKRFRAGAGMRLDAAGICALREVVSIYGHCLERLTEREMAMAQAETERRVREIMRRGSDKEVVSI